MDDSFRQWREGSKPSSRGQNKGTWETFSGSEDDSMSYTNTSNRNRHSNIVIQASDSDDDDADMFSNSRASAKSRNKSTLSNGVPESDDTADLDETNASVEEEPARKKHPKKKTIQSDSEADESYRSDNEDDALDAEDGSDYTDYSDDEDGSGPVVHRRSRSLAKPKDKIEENGEDDIESDSDTPIVRKPRKNRMILDDTIEEARRQSERHSIQIRNSPINQDDSEVIENTESTDETYDEDAASESDRNNDISGEEDTGQPEILDAHSMNDSNGLEDSNAIEDAESSDESYHKDDAPACEEDSVLTSGPRSRPSVSKTSIVQPNPIKKKMIFEDSVEEDVYQSERRAAQTKHNSNSLDDSNVIENPESTDESNQEDNVSTSHHNGKNLGVTSKIGAGLRKDDKSYVTISDTSDSDDKSNVAGSSTNTSSNVTDDGVVAAFARREVGVSNIDPLIEQKRAFLTCNIEQVQSRLAKSKMVLNTANIALLPDKGEKLRHSINTHEAELKKLSEELESLPKLGTPKPKVKKEPFFDLAAPPAWETLPGPKPVKELGQMALETHEREQALTIERLEDLHGSLNARPGEDERAKDPKGLKVSLMPHQQHALAWLMWREQQRPHGGILADDMGLGKTLTMISLILKTMEQSDSDDESGDSDDEWVHRKKPIRPNGGTLVVCPASLLSQWEGEIHRRCKRGLLAVELFHGNRREAVPRRLAKHDVVITTYNLLSREYKSDSPLYNIKWKRVILDEAHIVRNHKSQASEAVCNLFARNRWALTGTPIQNKELDLYALLKFLKCSPFDDLRVWKRWVDNKNAHGHERLATVMKTLMLRRTKVGLQALGGLGALPDKSLEEIHIKLDPEEQLVYEKVLVFSRTLFAQFLHQRAEKNHMFEVGAGKFDAPTFLQKPKETQFTKVQNELLARHADVKAHEILVLLLRLRQVCCHPALIHAMLDQEDLKGNDIVDEGGVNVDVMNGLGTLKLEDDENIDPNEIGVNRRVVENLLTTSNPVFNPARQSSKMRAVLNTIQTILDKGDKIVIVSQWTSMLEVVRSHLHSLKGASYDILSGNVPVKNRQQIVESFNKVGSSPRILLLSLTAGGVGLNLVGGNHLLLLDIHWNPQLEAQAQDRIYRVGQTKSVYIYKFMCLDTVEQRIKALQDRKLEIAQGVLTGAGPAGASKLTLDDLKSLFSL